MNRVRKKGKYIECGVRDIMSTDKSLYTGHNSQITPNEDLPTEIVSENQFHEAIGNLKRSHLLKKKQEKSIKVARMVERRNDQ